MSNLTTIAGIITYVGPFSCDEGVHQYRSIELQTEHGLVVLDGVVAASVCDKALVVGKDVEVSVTVFGGKSQKSLIWAVRDVEAAEISCNEEFFVARSKAVSQAVMFTLMAIIVIPVGLAMFVVPGLVAAHRLGCTWVSALSFPATSDIKASVRSMGAAGALASPGHD